MTNQDLYTKDKENYLPTFNRFPIAFIKGKGSRLWDADGKEYIDLLAGIAVNNVGHCHPKVVKAIQEQAAQLMQISNFFVSPQQVALSELLVKISGLSRVFLTNSGSESVETAIKIARRYGHKNGTGGKVISMHNSFHGRTLATIAAGQEKYQKGFEPIPAGFDQVPFNDLAAVEAAIDSNTAAIMLEPIQGEGGVVPAENNYLEGLRKLCDEKGVLLIFDEIQCGIGRTGKWFAKDHYGVQPDIMILAKGLGGGAPIGAVLCNEKVASAIEFGDHGTTFGGNPLAAAAALATIDVINEEQLCARVTETSEWLKGKFDELIAKHDELESVRGLGLMLGVKMKSEAKPFVVRLLKEGIVANATAVNILRLVPALNISREELTIFLEKLDEILSETTVTV
ncbi:acetylornithine/N-succinyldiaminopimelate aminotransferase [Algoriphagus ratkowskyi]|uniref:Acetylornithine aminotransferase n=1 Tax=Algoriphagus ratkowskyi TaxID=57028 RepID=A0A2W7RX35_9BACT|nr:aspartate aminotransferase family protein [Algoriphagus ratkowskyi]PZX59757.1 acetylornithine/N-succinyldiaminopimelate aminotransferase [Algoriphagus ratkowskyi]TXD78531.1 aspartate aminotransferase family protein [Algoriphagus ratkowskyi]